MREVLFYCNECDKAIKEGDLTQGEKHDIAYHLLNEGIPSFACSDCINNEMVKEMKKEVKE